VNADADDDLIIDRGHEFKLYRRGTELVLSVLCGSSAMYELQLVLAPDEVARFGTEGEPFLHALSRRVARTPEAFSSRGNREG